MQLPKTYGQNHAMLQRKLTDRGVANTQQAARVIKALGIKPNRFYTSPLLRAQQTADIVAKALGITPEVRKELGPGFSIHAVAAADPRPESQR